jgi:hypothetical protein
LFGAIFGLIWWYIRRPFGDIWRLFGREFGVYLVAYLVFFFVVFVAYFVVYLAFIWWCIWYFFVVFGAYFVVYLAFIWCFCYAIIGAYLLVFVCAHLGQIIVYKQKKMCGKILRSLAASSSRQQTAAVDS